MSSHSFGFSLGAEFVEGEVVVKLKSSGTVSQKMGQTIRSLKSRLGATSVLDVREIGDEFAVLKLSTGKTVSSSVSAAIEALENSGAVEYAEPNYIYKHFGDAEALDLTKVSVPNDTRFPELWGMLNTGQKDTAGQVGTVGSDVNVLPLWNRGVIGSSNVVVAVIDTGIQWDHPDLAANLYTNAGEEGALASNGIDDDGNGYIDDIHGFNFITDKNDSQDDHGHGTHCAGTIGAVGNNQIGVVGVNHYVKLMPLKFLSASGSGSLENAIKAIQYATKMKVNIMSNSWGGGGFSQALMDAIAQARDAKIMFVAAAGNASNNNDAKPVYPASYDVENVVAVAAVDNQDKLASFSNYGATKVHMAAPGVKILSTYKGSEYKVMSGTSMACPHVAGAAALIWAQNPNMRGMEVKARLIKTSTPVLGLSNKVISKGRLNITNAYDGVIPESLTPRDDEWKDTPFEFESEHPYGNNLAEVRTLNVPGAKFLRVYFESVDTELNYDLIRIETPKGELVELISGKRQKFYSGLIVGDTAIVKFITDGDASSFGFKVTKAQAVIK